MYISWQEIIVLKKHKVAQEHSDKNSKIILDRNLAKGALSNKIIEIWMKWEDYIVFKIHNGNCKWLKI